MATYQQIEGTGATVDGSKTFIYGDKWGYRIAEKLRQCLIALCGLRIQMGGSRHNAVTSTSYAAVWEYDDFEPPFTGFRSVTFVAECMSEDAGTEITPKIYDETAAADVWEGSPESGSSWNRQSSVFTPVAGHVYRAYAKVNNATNRAYVKCWIDRL